MIFDNVKKNIERNKKIKDAGGFNAIPWLRLPKFSKIVPGVIKGKYYLVTANSKVGKSQIADFMFVLEPYHFITTYPDTKNTLDIDFFLLEMSKEEKITKYLSHFIYMDSGIRISPDEIMSMYTDKTVSEEVFNLTRSIKMADKFENFESVVHFHDSIKNPYGIYKKCQQYAKDNGNWIDTKGYKVDWKDLQNPSSETFKYLSHYAHNDLDTYKINMVDHTSLLTPEKGQTLHATMHDWSANRALSLKNKYGHTMVDVQQQSADKLN